MSDCFEFLDVRKDATIEELQKAFERKASRYQSDFYADDPDYVKKKLKMLKEAYEEAATVVLGEDATCGLEKSTVSYDENPEEYMKQLYHKHLTAKVNRAAGLRPKRSKAFAKGDAAYKRSVMFFWIGIVVAVIAIGSLL